MGQYFINPDRTVNGSGSEGDPLNTTVGMPAGQHWYRLARGTTLREQITLAFGTSGAKIFDYGEGPLPIIDCEGVRDCGILCDARADVDMFNLEVRNQNAAAPAGGVRVSGSTGGNCQAHDMVFRNCRVSVHINSSPRNKVFNNTIYCGHSAFLTYTYGVRVNGASSVANAVGLNRVFGSATHAHVDCLQAYGAPYTLFWSNEVDGAMADGISLFAGADYSKLVGNLVYGALLKDALAIEDADGVLVVTNTVYHPGDLEGHSGPCLKVGDNFGAGTAPIGFVARNNLLFANNRLPMTLEIGSGAAFSNNLYWHLGADAGVVANLDTGGGVNSLNFTDWLSEGLDANSLNLDPLLDASYQLTDASPCRGAGIYIPGAKHFGGVPMDPNAPDIGAMRWFDPREIAATRTVRRVAA